MSWMYQVLSLLIVFGPVILGTVLWHLLWSGGPDSSPQPPAGGPPSRRPSPPAPQFGGDRGPLRAPRVGVPALLSGHKLVGAYGAQQKRRIQSPSTVN